jgi:5'-nucleotidase
MKPIILVTNDDGIHSHGLDVLAQSMAAHGRVIVAAPDREMSATSHSLTLNQPLRYTQAGQDRYAVQGTPADCVILASLRILEEKPTLVVSGVNRGSNVGDDINYSGTVAAASEAALQGIPAIAVSTYSMDEPDFTAAAAVASRLAERVLEFGLPPDVLLNVNFPEIWNGEVRWTRQGRRAGKTVLVENLDPRGRQYFWLHEELHHDQDKPAEDPMTDFSAVAAGYVSVTPLHLDRTAHAYMARFAQWVEGLTFLNSRSDR